MNCPRCETNLTAIQYEGMEIDTCPNCGGEWLDVKQLERIVKTVEEGFNAEQIAALDSIHKAKYTISDPTPADLACPRCDTAQLDRFNYSATSGIALDKCPSCNGIWFDKDELEHVQILVEEWGKMIEADRDNYGPLVEASQKIFDDERSESVSIYKRGFVNSVLRKFLALTD